MSEGPADLQVALRALASTLEEWGADWYLFGAQAVVIYGRPRATADIDATVDVELDRWRELADALGGSGFAIRVDAPDDLVRRTRVLPVVHDSTGIPVDLVLAGPVGLEREFLRRARRIDLAGIPVPVISPEDLVVSKVLAGRPKDLEDVRGIFAERGDELDLERIRELLSAVERALGRSDLLRELERVTS